jgi:hypothetical protein
MCAPGKLLDGPNADCNDMKRYFPGCFKFGSNFDMEGIFIGAAAIFVQEVRK